MAKTAPNRFRNEAVLEVDGVEYILRPTFNAIAKIEEQISTGSIEGLLDGAIKGRIKVADAVVILTELAIAGGTPLDDEALESYFEEHGTKWITLFLSSELLPRIVFGGKEYEKHFAAQANKLTSLSEDDEDGEDEDSKKKTEDLISKDSTESESPN